jgi:hypothetical protein
MAIVCLTLGSTNHYALKTPLDSSHRFSPLKH